MAPLTNVIEMQILWCILAVQVYVVISLNIFEVHLKPHFVRICTGWLCDAVVAGRCFNPCVAETKIFRTTRSIPRLMMSWCLASTGHQQQWYGLCLSSMTEEVFQACANSQYWEMTVNANTFYVWWNESSTTKLNSLTWLRTGEMKLEQMLHQSFMKSWKMLLKGLPGQWSYVALHWMSSLMVTSKVMWHPSHSWGSMGWVGLWGFLWWAPSAKGKDHHGVSSGWSSVWHRSNNGLSSTQYEQIPIILGVWPFGLTPFFFRSITFWRAYG